MNTHKCSFKVANNKITETSYPCYLFWCNGCCKQLIITKAAFWR